MIWSNGNNNADIFKSKWSNQIESNEDSRNIKGKQSNNQKNLICSLDKIFQKRRYILRYVHSLLQHSCVTDVSITYLPQLHPTHCTSSSLPCSIPQCSSQRRDENTTTAAHHNTTTVDYELTFILSLFSHSPKKKLRFNELISVISTTTKCYELLPHTTKESGPILSIFSPTF